MPAQLAAAQVPSWITGAPLSHPDEPANDEYGTGIAMDDAGTTAVIGTYTATGVTGLSDVFSFANGSWTLTQGLTQPDPQAGDAFGNAVAISPDGSTIVVGAYDQSVTPPGGSPLSGAGTAYVYTKSGSSWVEDEELTAPTPTSAAYFGYSVAVSNGGADIAIGSYGANASDGATYIFDRSGTSWNEVAELAGPSGSAGDAGSGVALSADGATLAVGAPYDTSSGAVLVYTGSAAAWSSPVVLRSTNANDSGLGESVALSSNGDTLLAGANLSTVAGVTDCGEAVVFSDTAGGWQPGTDLTPQSCTDNAQYGYTVGLSPNGDVAAVGAYEYSETVGSTTYSESGAADTYLHTSSGWGAATQILPPTPYSAGYFGYGEALSDDGSRMLIGEDGAPVGGAVNAGVAFPYALDPAGSTTTISAVPTSITGDGTQSATVTVAAADGDGSALTTGGATVLLSTTAGSLSPVTDKGNGTYVATLTGTSAGTATISGSIDGLPISSSATVQLTAPPTTTTSTTSTTSTTTSTTSTTTSTTTTTLPPKKVVATAPPLFRRGIVVRAGRRTRWTFRAPSSLRKGRRVVLEVVERRKFVVAGHGVVRAGHRVTISFHGPKKAERVRLVEFLVEKRHHKKIRVTKVLGRARVRVRR